MHESRLVDAAMAIGDLFFSAWNSGLLATPSLTSSYNQRCLKIRTIMYAKNLREEWRQPDFQSVASSANNRRFIWTPRARFLIGKFSFGEWI
jgi:hypothetical protein